LWEPGCSPGPSSTSRSPTGNSFTVETISTEAITITGASPATTTRDLADLVKKGALRREGERRHARYHFSIPIPKVSAVAIDERGSFD
jgi:hypothetical protein